MRPLSSTLPATTGRSRASRWGPLRRVGLAVLLGWAGLGAGVGMGVEGRAAEAQVSESTLKATFLYKFIGATEWPSSLPQGEGTPIIVAILGDPSFYEEVQRVFRGEAVHGHRLEVRLIQRPDQAPGAAVVFLGRSEVRHQDQLLAVVSRAPVLTVGESDGFCRSGGIITLKLVRDRLRFEVNPAALKRSGLRLSSQVMKLADIVEDDLD